MPFVLDNRSPIRKPIYGAVDQIGASKVAVVTLPVGLTYRGIILEATIAGVAATRAQLQSMWTQLRLTLSGTEIFTLTSLQAIAIAEFYQTGVVGDTGCLRINFARNWMKDMDAQYGPAFGTVGETSFTLEITQDATSTIDAIKVIAILDPVAQTLGQHVRIKRLSPQLPAVGTSQYAGLYKKKGEVLYALHVEVSTLANLANFTYMGDGIRIWDFTNQVELAAFYRGNTPSRTIQTASKILSFDFTLDNNDFPVPLTMEEQIIEWVFATTAPTVLNVMMEVGTQEQTQAGIQYAAAQALLSSKK